jgi:polyketide biosynthesis 3-hydroxy-3-methylglutaryl-CoA synthase-like enzyme PksG
MSVGIETLNIYAGRAFLDVNLLARARGLDVARMGNLLMKQKTVALHFEDPVTLAVNAAKPILTSLQPEERDSIGLLIVATESGLDFGKPLSTYVHRHLGLSRSCRNFEIKHACYGGTAALQTAAAFLASGNSPQARALVISTDAARPIPHTYAEPSQGAAAVAMLLGHQPHVLELEQGHHGTYGYEVMDSCRPTPEIETGDADLSLLTYLECIEQSFLAYRERVGPVDFAAHFDYLAFHTPFGGMAKGAHRMMMRKFYPLPMAEVEADFRRRLEPSLRYCSRIGNVYSGTVYVALAGALASGDFSTAKRIGLFSYGSGCCSEFFSGMATQASQHALVGRSFDRHLDERRELSMAQYERLLLLHRAHPFGAREAAIDFTALDDLYESHFQGGGFLVLHRISDYHREYQWS